MIIATDFPAKVSPPGCAAAGVVSSSNEKIAPPASRARLDLMRFLARGLLASCATFYERSALTPSRTASPRMRPAGANGSQVERGTERDHPRILSEASVAVQDAGARTKDILDLRLQHPPRRDLGLVDHLDHDLSAPHRIEEVSERTYVRIQSARIVADTGIAGGNADFVVGATIDQAFVQQAGVGVEIDQVAVVGHAAGANKPRETTVVSAGNAIEHLVHDTVDAGVAGVLERNACRHRVCEREAVIVEVLIAEARAGVIPRADAVSAREACGILPLVRQIAQFRDDEGAAAKAEHSAGGKRKDSGWSCCPRSGGGLKR